MYTTLDIRAYAGSDILHITRCVMKIAEAKAAGDGQDSDCWNWELAQLAEHEEDQVARTLIANLIDRDSLARQEALIRVEHTTHGRTELKALIDRLRVEEKAEDQAAIDAAVHAINEFAREDPIFENACHVAREEAAAFLRLRGNLASLVA